MSSQSVSTELPAGPELSPSEITFRWQAQPFAFLDECVRELGDRFTLPFTRFGTHVILSRPEDIRAVFAGDRESLLAGRGNSLLEPVLGRNSLLLLDGPAHLEARSMLQPSFSAERLQSYLGVVTEAVLRWTNSWQDDSTISMQRATLDISKEIILRVVLGIDEPDLARFSRLIHRIMSVVGTNASFDETNTDAVLMQRFEAERSAIYEALRACVEKRRILGGEATDMLGLLLAQRSQDGQPLSDEALCDHLLTMILAGHETTASSITWAMHALHSHPAVLSQLRRELAPSPDELPDSTLASLPFLQAVCLESLRLRPVIPVVSRRLTKPLPLSGLVLPAGVYVTPCAYLAHRREPPFQEPEQFQPQRFLDRRYSANEYFPFGGGTRRCIGMSFAMLEMQTVVGMLVRRFDFDPPPPVHPVRRAVTIVASGGAKMRVRQRRVH